MLRAVVLPILALATVSRAFQVNYTTTTGNLYKERKDVTSAVFADNVDLIENDAFWDCSHLTGHIDLSSTNVRVIGNESFSYTKITRVSFPSSLEKINSFAFDACYYLTGHINLSSTTVRAIGEAAFRSTRITRVSFPSSLELIEKEAFEACDRLTGHIDLSSTKIKIIEDAAFSDSGITGIFFPSSLEGIGASVFYGCYFFQAVDMPGVTSVGANAFYATNIISLRVESTLTLDDNHFKHISVNFSGPHFPSCNRSHGIGESFCNCAIGNVSCFPALPAPAPAPSPPNPEAKSTAETTRPALYAFALFFICVNF